MDYLAETYPDSIILDGSNDAIIGVDVDGHVCYSYQKCVECFMKHDKMSEEEAMEWIDYNTIRSLPYMGEMKPIMMYDIEEFC